MIEVLLCKALRDEVEKALKNVVLKNPKGELVHPAVINGFLPPNNRSESDYPCVVIAFESSSADQETTEVEVRISICTYDECLDSDGKELYPIKAHEDGLNAASRIRLALKTLPNGVLDRRYVLQLPIEVQNTGIDDYPYWQVNMKTRWLMRNPHPITDFTGDFDGVKKT